MMKDLSRRPYWLSLSLLALLCSNALSACGGSSPPTEQVNSCTTPSLPRIQTFTHQEHSAQILYVSSGTNLYALDAANGTLRWCDQLSQAPTNQVDDIMQLALDQMNLYAYTDHAPDNLTALNPTTGALRWCYNRGSSFPLGRNGVNIVEVPAAHETIYDGLDTMYALNERDGTIRWQTELSKNRSTFITTTPLAKDGTLYFGVDSSSNAPEHGLVALDAANGNQKWRIGWPDSAAYGGQSFVEGNLLVDQGDVFFSSLGQLDAVDARTGASIWQDKINPLNYPLLGANGLLYIVGTPHTNSDSAYHLYAIDMRDGSIRWSLPDTGYYLLQENNLYLVSEDGSDLTTGYDLKALNAQNGQELWQTHYRLAQPTTGKVRTLVILKDEIYVGGVLDELTKPGTFFVDAFHLRSGVEDWSALTFGRVRGSDPNMVTFLDMVGSS